MQKKSKESKKKKFFWFEEKSSIATKNLFLVIACLHLTNLKCQTNVFVFFSLQTYIFLLANFDA